MQTHNQQLAMITNSIYNAPLPANTTILHRNAYIANLIGSGDACDYVAEQTMQTTYTRANLLSYYHVIQGSSTAPISHGIALSVSAEYYRVKVGSWFASIIIPIQQDSNERLVFLLQIMDGRDDAGFDLRCL